MSQLSTMQEAVVKERGWDEGIGVPVANTANKALEEAVSHCIFIIIDIIVPIINISEHVCVCVCHCVIPNAALIGHAKLTQPISDQSEA